MPDCEPVRLWRERFKLNLSASWKADVEKTVTDLDLWKSILDGWFYIEHGKKKTKHPGIKGLLDEYERQLANRAADNETTSLSTRRGARISEGRDCEMPQVRVQPPSDYFTVDRMV